MYLRRVLLMGWDVYVHGPLAAGDPHSGAHQPAQHLQDHERQDPPPPVPRQVPRGVRGLSSLSLSHLHFYCSPRSCMCVCVCV